MSNQSEIALSTFKLYQIFIIYYYLLSSYYDFPLCALLYMERSINIFKLKLKSFTKNQILIFIREKSFQITINIFSKSNLKWFHNLCIRENNLGRLITVGVRKPIFRQLQQVQFSALLWAQWSKNWTGQPKTFQVNFFKWSRLATSQFSANWGGNN